MSSRHFPHLSAAHSRHIRRFDLAGRHWLVPSILAIGGTLALGSPAQARSPQNPPAAPIAVTEQVEVVATRVPERTHDVPLSIEVFDGDMLRAIGATNIREA